MKHSYPVPQQAGMHARCLDQDFLYDLMGEKNVKLSGLIQILTFKLQ